MPMCSCTESFATVELRSSEGRVLVCPRCAAVLENVLRLLGAQGKRRPVLGIVP